jgi:uncharacterized protein YbjT (DUF2867 family)
MQRQKIAVAGATGRVGHHVVDVLSERGHEVVPISRSNGVDVITGDGLAEALVGVDAIVDAATGPSPEEHAATEFFTTAARNLQDYGDKAGVQRLVIVSIIGIDDYIGGYGAAKKAHENAALDGPIPTTILRASQFHEFVETLTQWGTQGDTAYLPAMRTQLVAARTVAEALADLATGDMFVPEQITQIAGPREENLIEAARLLAERRGSALRIVAAPQSDDPDIALMEKGGMLPGPGAVLAGPTFSEWLADNVSS